ncbi:hypothetical protein PsYK624_014510 [Phanerochaete sordida]|uniref:Uncharacterized protein n=1 Tax=Phanerochaete sordida TaxID=48140 RepID=A0A9P3FY61_9APHY|nr:hypothetical protein PsYK624_014510 [Phanerochaete sordida]
MWMAIPFTLPSFATLHAAPKHEAWVILSRHEKMPMSSRTKVRTRTSVWKNLNGMPPADRPVTAADCSKSSEARVVHSRITRLGQPDYHLGGRTTLLGLKARFRARRFLQSGPGRIGDVMRSISVQGYDRRSGGG